MIVRTLIVPTHFGVGLGGGLYQYQTDSGYGRLAGAAGTPFHYFQIPPCRG